MAARTVLQARDLRKSFGGVHALRGVDLTLLSGRVHALLGENGAGKSTLINILSGILRPDQGSITIDGAEQVLESPVAAQELGIRTVHQELELAGPLSVAENILLGRWPTTGGRVDFAAMRSQAVSVLRELGADIDPDCRVDDLSVANRQLVEIARALAARPKVLFLDEPTAALNPVEAESLHERIRALAAQDVAVVYISHRLDEVLSVADDITVLRDGQLALATTASETSKNAIVTAMLGVELAHRPAVEAVSGSGQLAVDITDLSVRPTLRSANLKVQVGEVVGFFGLAGSGHDLIGAALAGLVPAQVGSVSLLGKGELPQSPREALRRGIGYVSADRKGEGLALGLSIHENILMAFRPKYANGPLVDTKREASVRDRLIERYRIKIGSPDLPVSSLSGGNQQKVVLARLAAGDLDLLVLSEPTRGVDVGAKAEIYSILREFAERGGAVIVTSADAEEINAVCDRTYVLHRGQVAAELTAGAFDPSSLTAAAL